jgi:hypothetical protein
MGSLVQLRRRTHLVPSPHHRVRTAPIQLDLVFDDARLRGMTPTEHQAVLRALARLLLEAGGVSMRRADDDHA